MPVQWRKEMAVDDALIDEDHKLLIEQVNNFEVMIRDKVTRESIEWSLERLKHYAVEHFRREEELQRAIQYPFYQAHAHEHRDLVKKLVGIIAHCTAVAHADEVPKVADETFGLLKEWLISHILHTDLRMRPYVTRMKPHLQRMAALRDSPGGPVPRA